VNVEVTVVEGEAVGGVRPVPFVCEAREEIELAILDKEREGSAVLEALTLACTSVSWRLTRSSVDGASPTSRSVKKPAPVCSDPQTAATRNIEDGACFDR
jgi:hypothetical protein